MDTNVKRREWVKTAAIIFLAVLLVLTFFSNTIMNASLPEVATQQVTQGTINAKIRASGTITANETYNVKLAQSRKIESVKCKVGQAVNAGDVLFVLEAQESDELKAAKTDLEAKELDYQKSLINASNDSAQEDRDVQKLRDAYNEALTIYNQYSSMDPSSIAVAKIKAEETLKEYNKDLETAQKELQTMLDAVGEIVDLTSRAFLQDDLALARQVEPLEQVIDKLKDELRTNHIARLQRGECSLAAGFVLSDLLTNLERVSDHCSNIAGCLLDMKNERIDLHKYLGDVKSGSNEFLLQYNAFEEKYKLEA